MVAEFPALLRLRSATVYSFVFGLTDRIAVESRIWSAQASGILPWLDQLRNGEHGAEQNAEAADDNVSDAKERVPAAHDGVGRQEQ